MISDNAIDDKENQYDGKPHYNSIDLTASPTVNADAQSNPHNHQDVLHRNHPTQVMIHSEESTTEIDDIDSIERNFGNQNQPIEIMDDDDDIDDDVADNDDMNEEGGNNMANTTSVRSTLPPANDFDNLTQRLMKPVPDYPVAAETHHVWEIKNWSNLTDTKVRGPRFRCGDFEWNILLFPRGNSNNNNISIYIEPHPLHDDDNDNNNDDWYVCAQFGFDLWNPKSPRSHYPSASYHRFNKNDTDWGFSSFLDLNQLTNGKNFGLQPILANNQLNITAFIRIIDDSQTGNLWYNFQDYDSKKSSGYVGLNNQGATCYLNSLLQSYYTTKIFRKLVYQIPTTSNTIIKSNKKVKKQSGVALSLQKIFYLLSNSQHPVGTLELTKSFGWDSSDAFTQHDVQELNRILMDKLETSMKNTPIENKLNDLFVGKMKSFIKCINVPYESSRVEDFWDIQLNVKGFKNLNDAFKNYIELEMLTDDNKYQAGDEYGYQDAKKGVVFQHFPPILHLQLKRFEYDFQIDDLSKINDYYSFPDNIDLSPYLDEDLSDDIKHDTWNYKLHGVLVHQGSISNGHYYAMIKPNANDNQWFRFEDDRVWKVTKSEVFDANFGANELTDAEYVKLSRQEQSEYIVKRSTSAYMLVYYREKYLNDILPVNDDEINSHIPKFIPIEIENQLNEAKLVEELRQKQLYNINVKLITLSMFQNYNDFDYYYDPLDQKFFDKNLITANNKPLELNFKKNDSILVLFNKINELKKLPNIDNIEDINNLPYRLLLISHRNNHTNRVDNVLNLDGLEDVSLWNIYCTHFTRKHDEMVFYVDDGKDLSTFENDGNANQVGVIEDFKIEKIWNRINSIKSPVIKSLESNIILFLKIFDPVTAKMYGLGTLTTSKDSMVSSIVPLLSSVFGITSEYDIFEELTPYKLEIIEQEESFEKNELSNGDILILQFKNFESKGKFKTLFDYYRFLATRLHVKVSPFKDINDSTIDNDDPDNKIYEDDNDYETGDNVSNTDEVVINKEIEGHESFEFWISTNDTYEDLTESIGKKIGVDHEYIRLFLVNTQGYKYPMKTSTNLSQYFPKVLPISTTVRFEYEILKISLKEFESMKTFKIYWINNMFNYKEFEIMISIDASVNDLILKLEKLLTIDNIKINKSNLLMWFGNDCKYVGYIKFNELISDLNESFDYYIGEFPTELNFLIKHDLINNNNNNLLDPNNLKFKDDFERSEFELTSKNQLSLNIIPVFHFYKSSSNHHSLPFLFIVLPNEPFSETKKRLQYKLGLSDVHFNKIKYALADANERGKYLDDKDDLILYDHINETGLSLALDHIDRNPRKNIFDKGIQIK